jgi:hypothetical protein
VTDQSNEPGDSIPVVKRPGRRRWQVGLRTLFLLMAAIAVWMAYFINRRHNAALAARIEAMVPLAHELIVDDPKKIAVVKREEHWYGENQWEIYLPEGRYRLCLATRGIGNDGLANVMKSAPIAAGRHQLDLEQRRDKEVLRVRLLWDGTELIATEEPTSDRAVGSYTTTGVQSSITEQLSPDQPAILLRRRFMRQDRQNPMATPGETFDGVLVWIERTAEMQAKP